MEEIQTPKPAGSTREQERSCVWLRQLPPAVGLLVLCVAAYWPLRWAGYIWDDDVWLTANPFVQHWSGLWYIWFVPRSTLSQYYPLIYTAFLLQFKMWGLNPLGYHLVNIILQAINSVLLWRILRQLGLKGAWVAAAIFAIHPVQVETVGWITEQKNMLSGLFYFSTILFWLRCRKMDPASITDSLNSGSWNWRFYLAASGCFFLALLAKTDACTLPVVLLLLAWWKKGWITKREILALLPWFILALVFAAVTLHVEHQQADARGPAFTFSWMQHLMIAGMNLWFYPFKLLWPHPLLEIYPRWNIDHFFFWQWIFPITAFAIPVVLWLWRKKIGRGPFMAVAYYGITITPVLGLTSFYTMVYTFVADHYQYLACIGIIVFIVEPTACGMERFRGYLVRKQVGKTRFVSERLSRLLLPTTASTVLLMALGILSYKQSELYNPQEKLWQNTLYYDPTSWQAMLHLAALADSHNHPLDTYNKIVLATQQPGGQNYLALNYLGLFYLKNQHDYSSAATLLTDSLELNPYQSQTICELAQCMEKLDQMNQAMADLQKGLNLMPDNYLLQRSMGELLGQNGQYPAALDQFRKVLQDQPFDAVSRFDTAFTLEQLGQWQEALAQYQQAIEITSDFAEAQFMYGKLLLTHGQTVAALEHLNKAVELAPDQIDVHLALAQALEQSGDSEGAAAEFAIVRQLENQFNSTRPATSQSVPQ
jgi:protein O-mannosyl-transferase